MKKIMVCVLLLFLSCSEKSCMDKLPRSSLVKSAKKSPDQKIEDLKKRISNLESDRKDTEKNKNLLGDLYNNLGNKYLDESEWDSAIEAFNNSLKYRKVDQIVLYSLGLAHGNKGKILFNKDELKKAEYYFEKSLDIEPEYSSAQYALAILWFFELNKKDKAVSVMERVVQKNKSFFVARFALGNFYYELGELNKSLAVFEMLCADLEKSPKSEIINEYLKQCDENAARIRSEI